MPKSGAGRYFALLATHFWKLIGVNLLFIVFSLPVVTMPAALCAMNRVFIKLIREGNVFLWEEFRDEFRADVLNTVLPAIFYAAALFGGYYFMSLASANRTYSGWCLIFWCTGIFLAFVGAGTGEFFFELKASLPLSNLELMKNARILCMISPGVLLATVITVLGFSLAVAGLMPVSVILLLLIVPALTQYTVCFFINGAVQKHIVGPYEEAKRKQTDS